MLPGASSACAVSVQLLMPPAVSTDLQREGLLYLDQRYTGRQFNISARMNLGSPRSPFFLNCTIPARGRTVDCIA